MIEKKIMMFILVFSIFIVLKECLAFLNALLFSNNKINMSIWRELIFGLSISYIFTIIFTGFSLS